MDENRFYNVDEIKQILKNNERLVYIDDGLEEVLVKYEDLPDAIIELSMSDDLKDLKVYEYGKATMTPILTTAGIFLDKCDKEVRSDIIERLTNLQMEIIKTKEFKIIDEYLLDEAREKLSEEKNVKIVYKEVGKEPVIKEIPNTLEAKQDLVNGLIEVIPYKENLLLVCNEEGKLMNLEPNLDIGNDYIVGNCFIIGDDYENADFSSVPDNRIEEIITDLKDKSRVIDKYMNRDKTNNVCITKEQFLNEIKEMIEHNILCYSSTNLLDKPKEEYKKEFQKEKQKLEYIKEIINDEKQKESRKKSDKEVR